MTETGAVLAANIERVFEAATPSTFDEATAGPEGLAELVSSISEYLLLPIPHDLRSSAEKVAELSRRAEREVIDEASFRAALSALRSSLESHLEQEEAADQFASDPEMLQEFLVESRAHLASVELGLLRLEDQPDDIESVNAVFRSFHTIKGLAGFLGAAAILELAHETENVLDLARSGNLVPTPGVIDLILKAADELNRCLDKAAEGNLRQMPRCDPGLLAALAGVSHGTIDFAAPAEKLQAVVTLPSGECAMAGLAGRDEPVPPATASRTSAEASVVRIETAKLEYLIDMVGELVIAESVVRHDPGITASQDPLLSRNLMQLGRVVQEVQKTSMSMRMVAVGTLFRKMTRLVRDLARKSGKIVEMVTVGDDVELDRSIVEDLADPMVHMMRNAVDHGIETAQARRDVGKPERGTVRLKASHDAGEIVIEISDDGNGLDPARILAKARRLGLVGEDSTLDDDSIFRLIFEPGFSTVDKVTDMSGRGVGMDVVRKQIQKLRGRIAIRSVAGKGCTFVLRLPLTLAIIDGLVVGVGSQRFILPMFAVREMFAPDARTMVTLENRAEAANFRGNLYPVVRLSRLLEGSGAAPVGLRRQSEAGMNGVLIVVESRDQLFCILVDQLIGKQEVVIKSLGRTFRDVPAVSGGAILGDGRVGLIIDVSSLRSGRTD